MATFVATGVAEKFIAVGCAVFEAESYILQLLLQTQDRSANIEKSVLKLLRVYPFLCGRVINNNPFLSRNMFSNFAIASSEKDRRSYRVQASSVQAYVQKFI